MTKPVLWFRKDPLLGCELFISDIFHIVLLFCTLCLVSFSYLLKFSLCFFVHSCSPVQRFSEHIPATLDDVESNNSEPKLILKRIRGASGSEKVWKAYKLYFAHKTIQYVNVLYVL